MAPAPHSCWSVDNGLDKPSGSWTKCEMVPPCRTRSGPLPDVCLFWDRDRKMKGCWDGGTGHARWGTPPRSLRCCHRWPPWFSRPRTDLLLRNQVNTPPWIDWIETCGWRCRRPCRLRRRSPLRWSPPVESYRWDRATRPIGCARSFRRTTFSSSFSSDFTMSSWNRRNQNVWNSMRSVTKQRLPRPIFKPTSALIAIQLTGPTGDDYLFDWSARMQLDCELVPKQRGVSLSVVYQSDNSINVSFAEHLTVISRRKIDALPPGNTSAFILILQMSSPWLKSVSCDGKTTKKTKKKKQNKKTGEIESSQHHPVIFVAGFNLQLFIN